MQNVLFPLVYVRYLAVLQFVTSALIQDDLSVEFETTRAVSNPGGDTDFRGPRHFDPEQFEDRIWLNRNSLHYQPMVLVLCAFSGGILLDYGLDMPGFVWCWLAIVSMVGFLIWGAGRTNPNSTLAALSLFLAFVMLGGFWHQVRWNWFGKTEIGVAANEVATPVAMRGRIVGEPRLLAKPSQTAFDSVAPDDRTRFEFQVNAVRDGVVWEAATGRTDLVVHVDASDLQSGMEVELFGALVRIRPPTNPGQVDFSFIYRSRKKLAAVHVYQRESITVLSAERGSWLASLRRHLNETIWRCVGEKHAGLASAILLGNREQMTLERREMYLVTGTVHLLAISGLHVGILAGLFFLLYRLGLLSRKQFLVTTILFTFVYCWLVEFRPPVTRASILISLLCIGRLSGRNSLTFNWLALAAFIVLAINPSNLFNLGPQLSFLAVATIAFGKEWMFWKPSRDPLDRLIANTRPATVRVTYWLGRQLRSAFLVSGVIWFVALPLVANKFHLMAPIALLLNPFLLIPIAMALYCGLGVLLFGTWLPGAGEFFGAICDWNLGLVESWIGWAESWTAGHCWTPGPPLISVWLFYWLLFIVAVYPLTRLRWNFCLAMAFCWLFFCWLIPVQWASRSRGAELEATFVDVGHGCGVVMRTPSGKTLLYDAGCLGSARYAATNLSNVLWYEQVSHIDMLFLSHADLDHVNAVPTLLKRFTVGTVVMTAPMLSHDSPMMDRLRELFAERAIELVVVHRQQQLRVGELAIEVLNPPVAGTGANDNSDSLTLLLSQANRRLLLCGDLERAGMESMLATESIDCDVVLAPHHGSKNSQPAEFVAWAEPEHVVVSASARKTDRAVVNDWARQGIDVHATGDLGAIKVSLGEVVRVRSWLESPW